LNINPSTFSYKGLLIPLILILLLAGSFALRKPFAALNLPYLYNIDDGPAVDWPIRIIRNRTLHPHQFIKPALPIYSLFPFVGIGFLKAVEAGEIRNFGELKTQNKFGDLNQEYTVSHPTVVKYMRYWCILVSLMLILAVYYLGKTCKNESVGILSAFFLSVSAANYSFSSLIWFISDFMTAIFVCLTILFAVCYCSKRSLSFLCFSAAASGLALSSKYNAFPALLVPLLAWTYVCFSSKERRPFPWPVGVVLVIILFGSAFILGSPYSLFSYAEFLDGAGWQVWAYKRSWTHVEVDVLKQLSYYIKWFGAYGVGWGILVSAILGIFLGLISKKDRITFLLLSLYPLLFVIYMSQQKINYVQNMLPVLPLLCVFAAFFVYACAKRFALVLGEGRILKISCLT